MSILAILFIIPYKKLIHGEPKLDEPCCQPKCDGGLGFKRPHYMNEAFLFKMIWNLTKKNNRMSYGVEFLSASLEEITILWFLATLNLMILPRKALVEVWNDFQCHVFWKIGDGKHTNICIDKWVPNRSELLPSAFKNFIDTTISVRGVLNAEGEWNLSFLCDNLPTNIVNQMDALPTPN
jgi:hypothetical protein